MQTHNNDVRAHQDDHPSLNRYRFTVCLYWAYQCFTLPSTRVICTCREQPDRWGRFKMPAVISVICLAATLLIAAQGFRGHPAHNGNGWFSRAQQIPDAQQSSSTSGSCLVTLLSNHTRDKIQAQKFSKFYVEYTYASLTPSCTYVDALLTP